MAQSDALTFHVVDVFTSVPFGGNPLAVVLGAEALSTRQMQQIARQFNLSETAFPLFGDGHADDAGADYRIRIFAPEVELPFAGHPSIGTAWLLNELGQVTPHDGQVVQLCDEGALPLRFGDGLVTLTGGEPRWGDAVDPAPMVAAVGLTHDDVVGPALVCSTGLGYGILPVRPGALSRCSPDLAVLGAHFRHPFEATGVYVVSWHDLSEPVRARMFSGDAGITEDPATGSAALAFGVYLAVTGTWPDGGSALIEQGVEMGRRSSLAVRVDADFGVPRRVRVAGESVRVAEGRIVVPPGG